MTLFGALQILRTLLDDIHDENEITHVQVAAADEAGPFFLLDQQETVRIFILRSEKT